MSDFWIQKGFGLVQSSQSFQGQDILDGFAQIALRMMSTSESDFQRNSKSLRKLKYDPDASNYFDLLPTYEGTLVLDGSLNIIGSCFKQITATAEILENGQVEVTFDLQESESLFCGEAIIVATDTEFFVKEWLIS